MAQRPRERCPRAIFCISSQLNGAAGSTGQGRKTGEFWGWSAERGSVQRGWERLTAGILLPCGADVRWQITVRTVLYRQSLLQETVNGRTSRTFGHDHGNNDTGMNGGLSIVCLTRGKPDEVRNAVSRASRVKRKRRRGTNAKNGSTGEAMRAELAVRLQRDLSGRGVAPREAGRSGDIIRAEAACIIGPSVCP